MRMRQIGAIQHHASAVYVINALHARSPLPYYDLFMAARSALLQPFLQYSIACMQVCSLI